MDPVFDAQFLPMKHKFSEQRIEIEVAYSPDGWVDYIYVAGQLLALDRDDNIERLQRTLRGLRRADLGDRPVTGDLVVLSTDQVDEGDLTVPEALDLLEERLGADNPVLQGREPLATPVHVLHTARLCAAAEPAVPGGAPPQPWPPVQGNRGDQNLVRLLISDTGLLENFLPDHLDATRYDWLRGVDGDRSADPLGRVLPRGLPGIPFEAGHGTFAAGVARSMAPRATVYVGNHFTMAGAALEYDVTSGLDRLIENQSPDVVNVPAGGYTRKDLPPLSFTDFRRRHEDITLVAAAGNDSTDRPFWPAAFQEPEDQRRSPWAIAVGALGADQESLAYHSNYGDWVDVYALGEGLVNAYATGVYTYQEPPKRPTQQVFTGMARWDGTSFASALVSGLIVAEIARGGGSAEEAAARVLERAAAQAIRGVGPALPFRNAK